MMHQVLPVRLNDSRRALSPPPPPQPILPLPSHLSNRPLSPNRLKMKEATHKISHHNHPSVCRDKSRASIVALFAKDLEQIKLRKQKKSCSYFFCTALPVISEDSTFMLMWDILLVLGLFWVMWAVPFEIAFAESQTIGKRLREGWEWLLTMDILVDIFFWLDLIINFRVTYRERNTHTHITDPYAIAYNYATTWFIPDLISVLPFSEISYNVEARHSDEIHSTSTADLLKLARVARFLKMTKLIRLLKVGRFIYLLEDRCGISPLIFSFTNLIAVVFIVIHFLACMFYLNSYTLMEITKPNYVHSWVSADHVSDSRNIFSSYVASMYWSCTTITTVGYGDITPKNDTDRVFVFFAMILGAGMYGYIIAALGNIISDMTAVSSIRRKKMMELSLFMDAKGLPAKLRSKVRESYRFWLERVSMYKEEEILVSLPQDLREKIAIHYAKKVFSEPDNLFSNAHPQFVAKVLPMLRPVLFQPYSTIVLQDDIAESMYIITKGILDVEVWIMMKESQQVEEELERERMDNEERTPLSLLPALSSVPSSVPPPNRTPGQKNGCVSLNSNASSLLKTKLSAPAPVLHSLPRSRIHKKSTKIATLLPGQIFGAMSILRPEQHLRRNASVKNRDHFCELFCIHRDEVVNTWLTYPTVSNYLLELTEKRQKSHEKAVHEAKITITTSHNHYWSKIAKAKTNRAIQLQKGSQKQ